MNILSLSTRLYRVNAQGPSYKFKCVDSPAGIYISLRKPPLSSPTLESSFINFFAILGILPPATYILVSYYHCSQKPKAITLGQVQLTPTATVTLTGVHRIFVKMHNYYYRGTNDIPIIMWTKPRSPRIGHIQYSPTTKAISSIPLYHALRLPQCLIYKHSPVMGRWFWIVIWKYLI